MREMYNRLGDLGKDKSNALTVNVWLCRLLSKFPGDVAQLCRQTQKLLVPPPPLLVRDVFSTLRKIRYRT